MSDIQAEYPWANTIQWAQRLRSLAFLKQFSLCTFACLVDRVGNKLDEGHLIKAWGRGNAVDQSDGRLERITVLYLYDQPGSCVSTWIKKRNIWRRETTIANPDFFDF
jgi:hypothetical protein